MQPLFQWLGHAIDRSHSMHDRFTAPAPLIVTRVAPSLHDGQKTPPRTVNYLLHASRKKYACGPGSMKPNNPHLFDT